MSARTTPIFQADPQGRVLAVKNWRNRHQHDDALVAVPLNTGQMRDLENLRAEGLSDSAIFDRLYQPPPPPKRITDEVLVPLEMLTRDQLVTLIRDRTNAPLPSLTALDRRDLCDLLRVLNR